MSRKYFLKIAEELAISQTQVANTAELLDEGATVPFIARYRKEQTGTLDEVAIAAIRDRMEQLRELDKRREAILKSLKEQEKLTDELEAAVMAAETMSQLEDIYLPYKPKRRTRATIAREKGLEPLAEKIFSEEQFTLEEFAASFIDGEKEVEDVEQALAGARDIIAEWVNEDADARADMRELFEKEGRFVARVITGKEQEGEKYKDYFDWDEDIKSAPSHRVLAMRRAEKELIITLESSPEEGDALYSLENRFVTRQDAVGEQVTLAVRDSYRRLMKPSMETEVRTTTKQRADEEAIRVFRENLAQLLMASPMGQKRVMGIDPGYRTGCKVVVLDAQGKLEDHTVIYPTNGAFKKQEAEAVLLAWCEKYNVEAIAIGNGTASRETETLVRDLKIPNTTVVVVNESGASVYSASEVARKEFPDHDITVRGAVSIGRRLMDPLAELVKIDPKSIGVGQYQHDVDQFQLKKGLDDTVSSCVNAVGVELNTASKELLTYVSGLGPSLAENIIQYRNEHGAFASRADLKNVPRLGPKAFEQAAGFLRVRDAKNPLDRSAVHPERYKLVQQMAKDLGVSVDQLMSDAESRQRIDLKKYVSEEVGMPTLEDIMKELDKPGRDPREKFEIFQFADGISEIEHLKMGMKLPGIVTNITAFGAFVDVGVHQDGLVHVSHLSDQFVDDPAKVVKVAQKVEVTVMEVDIPRKRISLSMKADPFNTDKPARGQKSGRNRQQENRGRQQSNDRRGNRRPQREESSADGDLQAKLAMLKGKFK
ncbi:Tex family protein [Persicobacter diffluens]|uniref:RNA-binding transcriptional accessory protein n=1 Tax=Persicobacter diffluens TaxID=981 RepID=A0AAN4VWK7_9BACT|nr:RNA-binding transcriptional accessory protein [Persicobacter diffluens]